MPADRLLTINQFAKFSRTTRDTLLYYDKIGLLTPVSRRANNYRCYSGGQLAVMNVIRTLQKLGMTLEEIKNLIEKRTPASIIEAFTQRIEKIDSVIEERVNARNLLNDLRKTIRSALDADENKITIQHLPAEAIVLGEPNDYSRGRNDYDALLSFYRAISEKYPKYDLDYPVWAVFSEERVKRGDWRWPDRYYFSNPKGHDKRPAAMYAVGYTRGGYGQSDDLYARLTDHIEINGFEICGDAYEEYPLNEICTIDEANYLMRVMIPVREIKRG
ncbi:MAG: MerR family transcriptional regulator [Oscillospiraceae bacterium]|nr:MerR family transcriptional regulator [Oscillospiraceae bacterium]